MLTAIREGSKGWISAIVIGLIVLTFALFGISSYLEGGSGLPVATVNGEEISAQSYQNALARQRQLISSRLGSNFDPELLETLGIRDSVINELVQARLLDQYTQDRNFRLSNEQLVGRIQNNQSFQSEGKFDPELYRDVLASNRLTPQGFEAIERQNGVNTQLQQAISDSAFISDLEVKRLLQLENQRREVQYAVIPSDLFISEIEVSEAEAKAQYDEDIDQHQREARIKVEFIDLSIDKLMETYKPDEDEIAQTYERLKGRFKTAEVRRASHILFTVNVDADEETKLAKLAEAETILSQARAGADFAALAAEHSDDPGSAASGGDLGVITSGQMVKPFEDAVFSMAQDEISDPVATQFGYHIIKLTEFSEERVQSLDEARNDVIIEAKRANAETVFADLVEPLQNLIFEQPESLLPAADETGLQVETSDWFTANSGEGVAAEAAVRRAAFAEDVLESGLNSQAIELGFERIVAIRKLDYEPSSPRLFEEVRQEIIDSLKLAQSASKVAELAESSISGLSHLASWDIMLAKSEWKNESLPASRDDIAPELVSLASEIYAAPLPAQGQPVFGDILLPNGDVAIYALTEVVPGEVEGEDTVSSRAFIETRLSSRDGSQLFQQFLEHLRTNAEVEIDKDQL